MPQHGRELPAADAPRATVAPQGSAREVVLAFLRLGLTSFGGPIAHLGYFREELVERRRWLDDRAYADLVALGRHLVSCLLLLILALPAAAQPARVVSLNLCTDQLALLLAAPGQLVSVTRLALDPGSSNLPEAAAAIPAHAGGAEEVFLLRPDLVLAGTFTDRQTIDMLRRLGLTVELFPPARSTAEIAAALRRMGALLGREPEAEAAVAAFEAELAALAARAAPLPRARAAYYYANDYTSGAGTLEDEILDRAGFDNAVAAAGLAGIRRLPLERFLLERPFLVRTVDIAGSAPALAHATLAHPALRAIAAGGSATLDQRWQVCGTPFVTRAIAALIDARLGQPQ